MNIATSKNRKRKGNMKRIKETKGPYRRYTREACEQLARKYTTLKEFREKDKPAMMKAWREGWLEDYTWLSRSHLPRNSWTERSCRAEAKKYKTLAEFRKACLPAYATAQKNGWLKGYNWLSRLHVKAFTLKECTRIALKYDALSEFRRENWTAYSASYRNGWLKNFAWLDKYQHRKKK